MYYFSRINNDEKMSELNQECIQDLIEKDQPMPMKLKRHVSIFKERVKKENDFKKKLMSTMGNAEEPLPEPDQYLKKYSRVESKKSTDEARCLHDSRKPQLPSPATSAKKGATNFILNNAKNVSAAPRKYTKKRVVDSHKGNSSPLQQPMYVYKKNFGVAPVMNPKPIKVEYAEDNCATNNTMHIMSQEERNKLIMGLEKNLKDKNADFLLLPVIIDTPYLINQKKTLENEIKQIEKDLHMIISNFDIYITDE